MLGLVMSVSSFFSHSEEELLHELQSIYPDAEDGQITAWRTLISDIAHSNNARSLPQDCLIGIEYSLPTDGMAIDFFVAGRNIQRAPAICIVESKQWNDRFIENSNFSFHREPGRQLHPQVQIMRHKLSFSEYLDIGPGFDVTPYVFIRNCSLAGLQNLSSMNGDGPSAQISMFRDIEDLFFAVQQEISSGYPEGIDLFPNAEYTPSRGIIDAMSAIITREPPFILTPEQEQVTELIRERISEGKKIIRVTGAAGTGKTAILLNLYVDLLNEMPTTGIRPIFVSGAQNTAYYQSKFPEVSRSFTYSYSLDKMVGPRSANRKIILMDEAQHNQPGIISDMVQRGTTLVLCYDPAQIINADNALAELKVLEEREDFVSVELHHCVRFNGSAIAEHNIERCLRGETDFQPDDDFEFHVFYDFLEFQNKIISVMRENPDKTVAVTGLLSSDADNFTHSQNPNSILYTDWSSPNGWEKAECRWMPYVTEKNYLETNDGKIWVGTWWMPGLDVDYIFVIVGGDAKMTRDGIIAVPECAKHFKMMASIAGELNFPQEVFSSKAYLTARRIRSFISRPENAEFCQRFMDRFSELLRNNYYIMMSRGRKGCFVFFTDNENLKTPGSTSRSMRENGS